MGGKRLFSLMLTDFFKFYTLEILIFYPDIM